MILIIRFLSFHTDSQRKEKAEKVAYKLEQGIALCTYTLHLFPTLVEQSFG